MVKKNLKLYELHEGQNIWINQEHKKKDFKRKTDFVRHVFAIGMAAYSQRAEWVDLVRQALDRNEAENKKKKVQK